MRDQDGMVATPVLFVLWTGLLLAIVLVDVGAYLAAAGRAQAAADGAALAAIVPDRPAASSGQAAAWAVARRNGAHLDACRCPPGSGWASVEVSVEVGGLVVPRTLGMQRVTATADARLTDADGGPSP